MEKHAGKLENWVCCKIIAITKGYKNPKSAMKDEDPET